MSDRSKSVPDEIKADKAEAATTEPHKQQAAFDFWARTIEAGQQAKAEQAPQQSPRLKR